MTFFVTNIKYHTGQQVELLHPDQTNADKLNGISLSSYNRIYQEKRIRTITRLDNNSCNLDYEIYHFSYEVIKPYKPIDWNMDI